MADRKGRTLIFKTPFTASLKTIKDAITAEVGPDKITVIQHLNTGDYLVELRENQLAEDLIENGFALEELHVQCNPPRGYYVNVSVMGLRAYVDDQTLTEALAPYGIIKGEVIRLKYKADHDLAGLENGNRLVRMILSKPSIPYSLKIGEEWCRIIHNNQQPICRECQQLGHSRRKCPTVVCNLCKQTGHISMDCPQRLTFPPPADTATTPDDSLTTPTDMEQTSNPSPQRQSPAESTPPAMDTPTTSEPQENASNSAIPPPSPPGPENTPMDASISLKRPHVSDSDSDTAKQKQQPRRPRLHPKPNIPTPRNKDHATSNPH